MTKLLNLYLLLSIFTCCLILQTYPTPLSLPAPISSSSFTSKMWQNVQHLKPQLNQVKDKVISAKDKIQSLFLSLKDRLSSKHKIKRSHLNNLQFAANIATGAVIVKGVLESDMFQQKTQVIQNSLGAFVEAAAKNPKHASFWVSKAQNVGTLASTVSSKISNFFQTPSLHTLAHWSFMVGSLAHTVNTMYEIYKYESYFEEAGSLLDRCKSILHSEILPLLDSLQVILQQIIDDETNSNLEKHSMQFSDHVNSIHRQLKHITEEIVKVQQTMEKDKEFYSDKFSSSMKHVIASTLLSAVSYLSGAGPLYDIAGLSMLGLNGGISLFAYRSAEKAEIRLAEFGVVQEQMHLYANETLRFVETFKHAQLQYNLSAKQARLEAANPWKELQYNMRLLVKDAWSGLQTIQWELIMVSGVSLWTWLFFRYICGKWAHDSVSSLVRLALVYLIIGGLFLMTVDVVSTVQQAKQTKKSYLVQKKTLHQKTNLQVYKHECLWHELSWQRQLFLQFKAITKTILLQDGMRELTMNKTGHLVNDPVCQEYLHNFHLQEQSGLHNDAIIMSESYSGVTIGLMKEHMKLFFDSLEYFNNYTSFTTKLWSLAIVILWSVLLIRRVLCCGFL